MPIKLKDRAMRGFFGVLLERVGVQVFNFITTIILARLLMPEEFGQVAMLAVFIAISKALVGGGFGMALIQNKEATYIDECSVFYFNLVLSTCMVGMLFFAAPWISDFYNSPELVKVARVLSLVILVDAFGIIQGTLLTKRIDFKSQMKVSVVGSISAGICGIAMAYLGFGIWSLVTLQLCNSFFQH